MEKTCVIGVPLCDGERELGVEKAPAALRDAGLIESLREFAEFRDLGDLPLTTPTRDKRRGKYRNLENSILGCKKTKTAVTAALSEGYFPLVIGGDCSLFPGAMAGVKAVHGNARAIYFDGHADFNTPKTTVSGYLSGLALATAVGKGQGQIGRIASHYPIIREDEVTLVGPRKENLEGPELDNLRHSKIRVLWFDDISERAIAEEVRRQQRFSNPIFLHLDLDVIDQKEMPALAGIRFDVHTPGGLTYQMALTTLRAFAKLPLVGMEVTLYNPRLDPGGLHARRIIRLIQAVLKRGGRERNEPW